MLDSGFAGNEFCGSVPRALEGGAQHCGISGWTAAPGGGLAVSQALSKILVGHHWNNCCHR